MGVEARIVLYAADEPAGASAAAGAFARIADLDDALTDYRTDSELMRLCARAGGPPVPVGPDFFILLSRARAVSEASGGAFDVSIGPVVRLWREARKTGRTPDPAALDAARALVDYRNIILDPEARTVRLAKRGMLLDLGGIGKGYAAQEALEVLRRAGYSRALVALAGDIALGDPPPGAAGWTIAVAAAETGQPHEAVPPIAGRLEVSNTCISTSGDREQFLEVDGKRYSHIIDPGTGRGSSAQPQVTVLCRDGAYADALATAATLVPREQIQPMIARFGTAAVRVQQTGSGRSETLLTSPNFPAAAAPHAVRPAEERP